MHFPVCLLRNTLLARLAPHDPLLNALGMLFAWGASIAAGDLFHRHVESRAGALGLPALRRFRAG